MHVGEPEGFSRLSVFGPAQLTLTCDDGVRLEATCFEAAGTPKAMLVIASALGVPRRAYGRLGEFMAAHGVACLTFDYRGSGDSLPTADQAAMIDMERWGRLDIDAAIRGAAALYPGVPTFLLGHSCGGQLFGLAPASQTLAGAILVAATLPHPSRYPRPDRYALSVLWRLWIPLFVRGAGHRATDVPGLSGAIAPKAVFRQWARWCRRRDYLFDPRFGLDTSHYTALRIPLLTIAISDDEQAPAAAVAALAERFTAAQIESRTVDVPRLGVGSIGHLGYFRSKCRDALWFPLLDWIVQHRRPAD